MFYKTGGNPCLKIREEKMKNIGKFLGIASVLCVLALLSVPVSALPQQDDAGPGAKINAHLDRLEEQGYDVSEIRTAIENGDQETARTLMKQFMEENRDELGMPNRGDGTGPAEGAEPGNMINAHLDKLEEQGYDVSEIRTAIENGDQETARTLMKQFMEENGDELDIPERGEGPRGPAEGAGKINR